jgi:hypothetical protein
MNDLNLLTPKGINSRKILSYWLMILTMLLFGSFLPVDTLFGIDTLVHFTLYGFASFIPMILFENRKSAFLLAIAMTPLGYILESVHMVVINGNFSAVNVLANNAGALAGMAAGFVVRLKKHYERDNSHEE